MGWTFTSGTITLKEVCDAYGVPRNMGALRGQLYIGRDGYFITVPLTGAIDFSQFRIVRLYKYEPEIMTLPPQHTAGAFNLGVTIDLNGDAGFIDASYTMDRSTLIKLTLTFYQTSSFIVFNLGAQGTSYRDESIYILVDGVRIDSSIGTKTFTLNATSTLSIHITSTAYANAAYSWAFPIGGHWNYSISGSGLTLV
jgi:hypothetical protein